MLKYEYALAITSQFYFCGIPFRLDTTPKCSLNCGYCFAMARGGRRTSANQIANPESLYRRLYRAFYKKRDEQGILAEFLNQKIPVHFGGMSDPFSNERVTKVSLQMLEILNDFGYPVVISTKNSDQLIKDSTIDLLKKLKNVIVQISVVTSNRRISKIIEPHAPTPSERIKAVNSLSSEGINVIIRLQPLFLNLLTGIKRDLIPRLGEANATHIIVEFLKLPVEKSISIFKEFNNKLGVNYYNEYAKKHAILVGREWLLPNKVKWEMLQPIIRVIHMNGMTFGAADYGLNHLGDTNCCCGIDGVEGFSNWFKGNFPSIIASASSNLLYFGELENSSYPQNSIKRYMNSNCRLNNGNSILDYLAAKWNRPSTNNAPDTFLGVSWSGERDSEGHCIYLIGKEARK